MNEESTDINRQQRIWEAFWEETRGIASSSYQEARPIWDADPNTTAIADLQHFKAHMDPSLPLIDYGCGNGTQTVALAKHFSTVIGTDVSGEAIVMAKQFNAAPNVSYRTLDALKLDDVRALHNELGDVNLYVRTVLHFLSPSERALCGEGMRILLGERGTMFIIELGPQMPKFVDNWIKEHGMPKKLERIVSKGVGPGMVAREDIDKIFPADRYRVMAEGECRDIGLKEQQSAKLEAEGREVRYEPPMYFAVVKPSRAK